MDNTSCVPRAALLDAWSDDEWTNGIQLDQMAELETLAVRTQNSVYEITVLCGRTGEVLPDFTLRDLDGVPVRLSDLRDQRVLLTFERSVDW